MKVKQLKEYLVLYEDEKEVKLFGGSGLPWDIDEVLLSSKIVNDEKREICKIYIK